MIRIYEKIIFLLKSNVWIRAENVAESYWLRCYINLLPTILIN